MRTQFIKGLALALTVAVVACDDSTGPDQLALANAENEFLALEADQSLNFILDDALAAYGDPEAGVMMAAEQDGAVDTVVTNFTFERTRPCRVSGEVVANGEGTKLHYGQTVELSVSGVRHQIECARVRGDVVITINGIGAFDAFRKRVERVLVEAKSTVHGAFRYETSDGRSGRCEYRIMRELIPGTDQIKVTGTFCGHEVDRVIDRPVDRPSDSA